jgi:anti-anti-sigma factor
MEDVLTIQKEHTDGVTIVRLSGELDALNVSELEAAVAGLSHEESRLIVVDLQGIDFIDSAGLGGLVRIWEGTVERGGFIGLGAISDRVRDVLQITGLANMLIPHGTNEDAIGNLRTAQAALQARDS